MSNIHYKMMMAAENPEKFYGKLGRFLASRQVRKEIGGYPINNEDDWPWLVAIETRTFSVIGFMSMEPAKHNLMIHDYYVVEPYRNQRVFDTLLEKAIHYADFEKTSLYASVREPLQAIFEKRGFSVVCSRGQWLTMGRVYNGEDISG